MQVGDAALADAAEEARYEGARDGEVLGHVVVEHVAHAQRGVLVEELARERLPPRALRLRLRLLGPRRQPLVQLVQAQLGLQVRRQQVVRQVVGQVVVVLGHGWVIAEFFLLKR